MATALHLNALSDLLGAREVCALNRPIGTLLIALTLVVSSMAWAGPETGGIIVTSGTVKHVEVEKGIVDSGRVIAVRTIQRDGHRVELQQIKIEDDVFVSGNDLGVSADIASQRAR